MAETTQKPALQKWPQSIYILISHDQTERAGNLVVVATQLIAIKFGLTAIDRSSILEKSDSKKKTP